MENRPSNIDDIYLAALERSSAQERVALLDSACAGNPELRRRVERLLEVEGHLGSFLEAPAPEICRTVSEPGIEQPGSVIGPYKLLQQIGEGGMGVVYMAGQEQPVKRRVAVKIIKPGMDTRQVIARFEAERQALALMDHPNIAKVLDAGTTESGRPYFVMELVKGQPITQYCDEKHFTPRQRLELLLPVCQAIQHAHQKGIIHRDIKPTNILVAEYDGKPTPKVIDFGVAKATSQSLTERTMFTGLGQIVGTLEYMSPEQAGINQLDIDTRSDIYSLGVLLYELLTGSTPFSRKELEKAGVLEMLRVIREQEPSKPSTKLSTADGLPSLAANRGTEPAKLTKLVRGELDWIVMKALEKDRNRRYETANGLAMDLQRYLADEPVQACPPSAMYRFGKFARRNKGVLTTAALLGVMLLAAVGTVAGSLGWVSRGRAARLIIVEQAVSRALEDADQSQKQGDWQQAMVAVERAQAALVGSEGAEYLQQRVRDQLTDLRLIQRLEECRTQRADILDNEHQNDAYAQLFTEIGIDEGLTPADAAARILRRPGTAVHVAAALDDWANVRRDCGFRDKTIGPEAWKRLVKIASLCDPDPWRVELRQLMGQEDLKALRKLANDSDIETLPLQSLQLMGAALILGGDAQACIDWLRKAHRQHPEDALIAFELGFHLSHLPAPDWAEVLRFAEAALAARRSAGMYHFVGSALNAAGRHQEAIDAYHKAIELKGDYPLAHGSLGNALRDQGRLDEAIAAYRKVIELTPKDGTAYSSLGVALSETPQLNEAIAAHYKAIELKPDSAWTHIHLGYSLTRSGQRESAIAAGRRAVELQPDLANAHDVLGFALLENRQFAEAIAEFAKAVELQPDLISANISLAHALRQGGRLNEAIVAYRKVVEMKPRDAWRYTDLGVALSDNGEQDEAIAAHRHAVELTPDSAWAHLHLGYALSKKGQHDEAIAAGQKAIELQPDLANAYTGLGFALERAGRLDEAITAYRKVIELTPNDTWAYSSLGVALSDARQPDKAIAAHNKAIELKPDSAWAHIHLAFALSRNGQHEEAIAAGRRAVELQPDLANAHDVLGMALSQHGQLEEAITAYEKAVELKPDFIPAHVGLANTLRQKRRLHEAIAVYRKVIQLTPTDASAYSNLGIALSEHGQQDEAIAVHSRAIELAPNSPWAHVHLSYALTRKGRHEQAIAASNKAIELQPDIGFAHASLGYALEQTGRLDEAIACYRKATELDPKNPVFDHDLGHLLNRRGKTDEAIACYRKAIELEPKNARFSNNLAWLLVAGPDPKLYDPKYAIELAKNVTEQLPDDAISWNTLGVAHYRAGNWRDSINALRKSEELRRNTYYGFNAFFLAMAHWQLDEKEEARRWYDGAVAWMEKYRPNDEELKRFRAEAPQLLGLEEKQDTSVNKNRPVRPRLQAVSSPARACHRRLVCAPTAALLL